MTSNGGSRRPNAGRIYNFLLGGKDNYEQDRQAAGQLLAVVPDARAAARANRRFLGRAVRFLAQDAGIRQFIDIGAGLPATANVHQVARELDPRARVAYVDNDPVVVSHARALLCTAPGVCAFEGDLRDPPGILGHPDLRAVIDLGAPVAIVLAAVMHFVLLHGKEHVEAGAGGRRSSRGHGYDLAQEFVVEPFHPLGPRLAIGRQDRDRPHAPLNRSG